MFYQFYQAERFPYIFLRCAAIPFIFAISYMICFQANSWPSTDRKDELFHAVLKADLATGKHLLASGVDVNSRAENGGFTALIFSAWLLEDDRATCNIVRLLLSYHANVNMQTTGGDTALLRAVANGHLHVARLLLQAGADPRIVNQLGFTALGLTLMTKKEDAEFVDLLLQHGADPNILSGPMVDKSPLMVAAEEDHLNTVRVLLSRGAKINLANKDGITPIFAACKDYELFLFLWKHGAFLTSHKANGFTLLMQAAYAGNLDAVEFLLRHGADINACTPSGDTALVSAADSGNVEVVEYLLAHGARLDRPADVATKAMRGAIYADDPDTVKLLLSRVSKKDRDPKLLSEAMWGLLDYWLLEGRFLRRNPWRMGDTVQLLLAAGALLPDNDEPGRIRLLRLLKRVVSDGLEHYYLSVWQAMLAAGLNVNERGEGDETALMIAAAGDSAAFVDLLLRHGADLSATDEHGQTALTLARKANAVHVIPLLERR